MTVGETNFTYRRPDRVAPIHAVWRPVRRGEVTIVRQVESGGTMLLMKDFKWKDEHRHHFDVPGTIIHFSPPDRGRFVGDPSIVVMPNGDYVASHSYFAKNGNLDLVFIYGSRDRGSTWTRRCRIEGQSWGGLFNVDQTLYLMGAGRKHDLPLLIRRSRDGGRTWTEPRDSTTGRLREGPTHTAPVPVLVHEGRVWRGVERMAGGKWSVYALSAPVTADLLNRGSWTFTQELTWPSETPLDRWSEANMVRMPSDRLALMLRLNPAIDKAAIIHFGGDNHRLRFDPKRHIIDFPGGHSKFTIRYDPRTQRYWSLVNLVELRSNQQRKPALVEHLRNVLALTSSKTTRDWTVHTRVLDFSDGYILAGTDNKIGFQYADWQFDGDDIVAVLRVAWGHDVSRSHDANYLTFTRIPAFRNISADSISPY